ncbi:MAG: hypothetical protein ACKODM_04730, partial [Cytophagales bacterium]
TYTGKHLDVVTSLWHNNQVFDNSGYSTAGINIAYSRAKLGKHWLGSAGITGLTSLLTSNEKLNPSRSRIMVTLAVSWVH